MTIAEFLCKTDLPMSEIAKRLAVHISQVHRWRDEDHVPSGVHLAALYELSGRAIDLSTVKKRKPRVKRTTIYWHPAPPWRRGYLITDRRAARGVEGTGDG